MQSQACELGTNLARIKERPGPNLASIKERPGKEQKLPC